MPACGRMQTCTKAHNDSGLKEKTMKRMHVHVAVGVKPIKISVCC
jgi:hypothetical protein